MLSAIIFLSLVGSLIIQPGHVNFSSTSSTIKPQAIMATQSQDTLTVEQYGQKLATFFYQSNWQAITGEIYPVNLPENWPVKVKPLFEAYFGMKLKIAVISLEEIPDYLLHWIKMAPPEVLANTPSAIRLSYDHSTEKKMDKGKFYMAVYQHDGSYSILMVGGHK